VIIAQPTQLRPPPFPPSSVAIGYTDTIFSGLLMAGARAQHPLPLTIGSSMWLEPLSRLFLSLALLAQVAAAATPAAPEPFVTRQTVFAIPFRVEHSDDSARLPVELQLLRFGGSRHTLATVTPRRKPTEQQFMFRAGGDGEYWFAIRSVDHSGRVRPETIAAPGLRVLVDTTPPQLKLTAQRGQAGQVVVRWEVSKPNIKPDGLNIQYRTSSTESVAAAGDRAAKPKSSSTPQTGQVTFRPKAGANEIQLQADVADTAGNSATAHTELKLEQDNVPAKDLGPAKAPDPTGSVAIRHQSGCRHQFGPGDKPSTGSQADPSLPPWRASSHWVNSRLFELDYDVDSVWPVGHWEGGSVGNPRRRKDLAQVRPGQTIIAAPCW